MSPWDGRDIFALCDLVRESSFALHCWLRHGHLEKVYENGLTHRLQKAGLRVERSFPSRFTMKTERFWASSSPICSSRIA